MGCVAAAIQQGTAAARWDQVALRACVGEARTSVPLSPRHFGGGGFGYDTNSWLKTVRR